MRNVLFLLSAVVLLSACGMKGPLYLPPEPAAQPPATAPAAGAQSDAKKNQAAGQTVQ
jgi:predicted small lipoprotein YifL